MLIRRNAAEPGLIQTGSVVVWALVDASGSSTRWGDVLFCDVVSASQSDGAAGDFSRYAGIYGLVWNYSWNGSYGCTSPVIRPIYDTVNLDMFWIYQSWNCVISAIFWPSPAKETSPVQQPRLALVSRHSASKSVILKPKSEHRCFTVSPMVRN